MADGLKPDRTQINIDKILRSIPTATTDERATMKSNAEGWLATGTEPKREAAKRLLDALDAQKQKDEDERILAVMARPEAERVILAFKELPMAETEAKLIQVLLDNPGLTSTALSVKIGWEGKMWHLKFGEMCKVRSHHFPPPPYVESRTDYFWSGILADLEIGNLFVMKPEAVKAFHELGLRRAA